MVKISDYKAVILAGGKGTRLYPITYEIPKPLLPVRKKPIINYLIDLFLKEEIKDIAVLISKDFREEFTWWKKRYYPKNKIKFVEEKEPLGTFGGLWYLKRWISKSPFFLTNGDELKKIDLSEMNRFHQEMVRQTHHKTLATIALVKVPDPQNYGVVISKNGKIKEFLEKPKNPPSNYINSGLYLLSPEIFNYMPHRQLRPVKDNARVKAGHPDPKFLMIEKNIFPKLAKEKKLAGFKFNGKWADCGTFERYSAALKNWQ